VCVRGHAHEKIVLAVAHEDTLRCEVLMWVVGG